MSQVDLSRESEDTDVDMDRHLDPAAPLCGRLPNFSIGFHRVFTVAPPQPRPSTSPAESGRVTLHVQRSSQGPCAAR